MTVPPDDEDAFLRAIRDAPDDAAVRLQYADWLDDIGEVERAEAIRLQHEQYRAGLSEGRHHRNDLRLRELIARHGGPYKGATWVRGAFQRCAGVRGRLGVRSLTLDGPIRCTIRVNPWTSSVEVGEAAGRVIPGSIRSLMSVELGAQYLILLDAHPGTVLRLQCLSVASIPAGRYVLYVDDTLVYAEA
ncbi:MAG: TIGR02996 domain-containing protein [Gemmataceae bacterium]